MIRNRLLRLFKISHIFLTLVFQCETFLSFSLAAKINWSVSMSPRSKNFLSFSLRQLRNILDENRSNSYLGEQPLAKIIVVSCYVITKCKFTPILLCRSTTFLFPAYKPAIIDSFVNKDVSRGWRMRIWLATYVIKEGTDCLRLRSVFLLWCYWSTN